MQLGQPKKKTRTSSSEDRFAPLNMDEIQVQPLVRASDGKVVQGRVFPDAPRAQQKTQLGIAPSSPAVEPRAPGPPPPPTRSGTALGIIPHLTPASAEWGKRKLIVPQPPATGTTGTVFTSVPNIPNTDDELELLPDEHVIADIVNPQPTTVGKQPPPVKTSSPERSPVKNPQQPPAPKRIHVVAAKASSHPPAATPGPALPAIPPTPAPLPQNPRLRSESEELRLRNTANASGLPPSRSVTPPPVQKPMFPPPGEDVPPDEDDVEFDEAQTHHHPGALPKVVRPPVVPAKSQVPLAPPLTIADKNEPQTIARDRSEIPLAGFPRPPSMPNISGGRVSSKPPPRIAGTTRPPQSSVAPTSGQVKRPTHRNLDVEIQTFHEAREPDEIMKLSGLLARKRPATFQELRRIEFEFRKRLVNLAPGAVRDDLMEAIGYVAGRIDAEHPSNEASQANIAPRQTEPSAMMVQATAEPPKELSKGVVQTTPTQPLFKEAYATLSNIAIWFVNIFTPVIVYSILYKKATTEESLQIAGLGFVLALITTGIWTRTGATTRSPLSKVLYSGVVILIVFSAAFMYQPRIKSKNIELPQTAQQKTVETVSPNPSP